MNTQKNRNTMNGKTELNNEELEIIRGGEVDREYEYGPDDDICRYHCRYFKFKCYDDLNVPMCPANCANHNEGCCCYPR